jgi:uracil-DNA glycosylase
MRLLYKHEIDTSFYETIDEARQCTHCAHLIPHNPRPILRGLPTATILIVGQAPGLKAHETGLSFNDPSGDRLRSWLELDRCEFYDETKIAIMPIGLCFPGRNNLGADLPPLKACAPLWHP